VPSKEATRLPILTTLVVPITGIEPKISRNRGDPSRCIYNQNNVPPGEIPAGGITYISGEIPVEPTLTNTWGDPGR